MGRSNKKGKLVKRNQEESASQSCPDSGQIEDTVNTQAKDSKADEVRIINSGSRMPLQDGPGDTKLLESTESPTSNATNKKAALKERKSMGSNSTQNQSCFTGVGQASEQSMGQKSKRSSSKSIPDNVTKATSQSSRGEEGPDQAKSEGASGKNTGSSRQSAKTSKNIKLAQMMKIYSQQRIQLDKLESEREKQRIMEQEEEERIEKERIEKEKAATAKKELKKQKIEQMKKDGIFMSPAKKKAEARNKEKLAAMINSGNVYNAVSTESAPNVNKDRVKYATKKDHAKKKRMDKVRQAANAPADEDLKPSTEKQDENEPPITSTLEESEDEKKRYTYSVISSNIVGEEASSSENDPPEDWSDILLDEDTIKNDTTSKKKTKPTQTPAKNKQTREPSLEYTPDNLNSEQHEQSEVKTPPGTREQAILRSPICCILGHVDSGKTRLLDKIRQSNVQGGEAGGITQQIGATFFPINEIAIRTKILYDKQQSPDYRLPGLLIIDTPGHESFSNLRQRGSSMCNIAILVIDILSGFEKQTLESLNMLKRAKTPFVVALNKIDRIYGWKSTNYGSSKVGLSKQQKGPKSEFNDRLNKVILQFAEEGLNSISSWENKNMSKYVSIVPVSALTGEGLPDLLDLLITLTQSKMTSLLTYKDEVNCTVLEVKVVEGLGTVIDVILSSGELEENQRIAVCGMTGAIKTTIRSLLTPQPMTELRVKCPFISHKKVRAALGVRIAAPNLEKAVAGSNIIVLKDKDDESDVSSVMGDFNNLMSSVSTSKRGVCVQASSLGSLEALIAFFKSSDVPIIGVNIGPVHKKDVIRASTTLETAPEYAQILAFDVPVEKDAQLLADELNVIIFKQNVIYRLFDEFTKHIEGVKKKKQLDAKHAFVYPCIVEVVPNCVFNKVNPIIIGVNCVEGTLKLYTPLCVMDDTKNPIHLGRVTGIEHNHVAKTEVSQGGPSVSIKIESPLNAAPKVFGRHLNEKSFICSHMTSEAIDLFDDIHKDTLKKADEPLLRKLKKLFNL